MKKINLLAALFALFCLSACVEDDTTLAVKPISEITIVEGSVQKVYNIHANDRLVIDPQIVQTNEQKPLQYAWEMDFEIVSREKTFNFVATELGSFNCRLIVENEDGKAFFPFTLNVNTAYEEGLTVISNDPEGNSFLSFMLTPTDGSDRKFYDYNCFSVNNVETKFASNVVDVVQCDKNLMLVCQGAGKEDDVPTIYYLNDKTFVIENEVKVTEYPDFKPVRLAIPSASSFGATYPILCENGKIYDFSAFEGAVEEAVKLQSTYANACVVKDANYYDLLFWDKDAGGLALIYTGYGPYYCSKTYHASRQDCINGDNYFAGRSFVAMTLIHQTPQQLTTNGNIGEMIVLTANNTMINKVVLCTTFHVYDYETATNVLYDNGGMKLCSVGEHPLNETTPCIANKTYYSMLFAKGNKVMRWYYTSSDFINQAKELPVGIPEGAEITSFEISEDHKKTYVSFWEPDKAGKNGSVWVFDTDTGEVFEKHNNVCYKPVKMIYKKK